MSNLDIDISIVIPAHNESHSLDILIPNLLNVINTISKNFEVIIVNDASTDNTLEIISKYEERNEIIRVIDLQYRGGQTICYKEAFKIAKGKYIIRMDADLQDDPTDLPLFIDKINSDADLIVGLREARKHTRSVRIASALYDLLILTLFNSPLHSNSGSYVCFKKKYVLNIPWRKNDHRYLPLIAMKRGAKKISEVIVKHNERKYGVSKYKPFKKIILGIPEVILFLNRYKKGTYNLTNNHI